MKRTKTWWARLTPEERSELVYLERADKYGGRSSFLPDDCSECGGCSMPHLGSGLCSLCSKRLEELIRKADEAEIWSMGEEGK